MPFPWAFFGAYFRNLCVRDKSSKSGVGHDYSSGWFTGRVEAGFQISRP